MLLYAGGWFDVTRKARVRITIGILLLQQPVNIIVYLKHNGPSLLGCNLMNSGTMVNVAIEIFMIVQQQQQIRTELWIMHSYISNCTSQVGWYRVTQPSNEWWSCRVVAQDDSMLVVGRTWGRKMKCQQTHDGVPTLGEGNKMVIGEVGPDMTQWHDIPQRLRQLLSI